MLAQPEDHPAELTPSNSCSPRSIEQRLLTTTPMVRVKAEQAQVSSCPSADLAHRYRAVVRPIG